MQIENNLILADAKAKSLGFGEGTDEYGLTVLMYTLALNDIDERGEIVWRNQLMAMVLFKMGEISTNTRINSSVSVTNKYQSSSNPLSGVKYTKKVQEQMAKSNDAYHNFPSTVDSFGSTGVKSAITGGDGVTRTMIQIPGAVNGKNGVFEYILEADMTCNHRLFVPFK